MSFVPFFKIKPVLVKEMYHENWLQIGYMSIFSSSYSFSALGISWAALHSVFWQTIVTLDWIGIHSSWLDWLTDNLDFSPALWVGRYPHEDIFEQQDASVQSNYHHLLIRQSDTIDFF